MTTKDPKKSEAAKIRWNAERRRRSVYVKILAIIAAYERDHGPLRMHDDEAYVILAGMGYRTKEIPLELPYELGFDPMKKEILP